VQLERRFGCPPAADFSLTVTVPAERARKSDSWAHENCSDLACGETCETDIRCSSNSPLAICYVDYYSRNIHEAGSRICAQVWEVDRTASFKCRSHRLLAPTCMASRHPIAAAKGLLPGDTCSAQRVRLEASGHQEMIDLGEQSCADSSGGRHGCRPSGSARLGSCALAAASPSSQGISVIGAL
jgi:hypothetical protein